MKNEQLDVAYSVKACMKKIAVLLIAVPLLATPVTVSASNGGISFRGQITNPTCAASQPATVMTARTIELANVSAQITVMVESSRTACGQQAAPFSTRFTLLPILENPVSRSEKTGTEGRAGILTMSYE